MAENINDNEKAIINDKNAYNKKIKPIPKPQPEIGLDKVDITDKIIEEIAGETSTVDLATLNSFTQVATNRNQLYNVLDLMGQDSIIASVLETYAEDATEYNDEGRIVWAESKDAEIGKYVNYLLKTMQIDKNAYPWVYSLCLYGDLYLQLFKESEYGDDLFDNKQKENDGKTPLNEDVKLNVYKDNDKFVNYLEKVDNPARMFDLTRFGKTAGFIQTSDMPVPTVNNQSASGLIGYNTLYKYNTHSGDVELFDKNKFVHASLEGQNGRTSEEVKLFRDENIEDEKDGISYKVKKGQSLLYNAYKIWRELSLLEDSVLLNRVTKSSIVRMIQVEVGDMPKEQVQPLLQKVKALFEQKSAFSVGNDMTEYNNPGPVENNVYFPTYNGKGAVTTSEVGGETNVGQLPDLDYYQNKFFGSMRIPKQYFGLTDDGAGFNGGQSLSIISSRYAKSVKRIQNALIQALTTAINILLLDKGMTSYINMFTLKMQSPTTQEEIDRRENKASNIQIVRDIMDLLSDIDNTESKLKILKILLANIVSEPEVIDLIEDEIKKISEITDNETDVNNEENHLEEPTFSKGNSRLDLDSELGLSEPNEEIEELPNEESEISNEEPLPTPEELGDEFTDFENQE